MHPAAGPPAANLEHRTDDTGAGQAGSSNRRAARALGHGGLLLLSGSGSLKRRDTEPRYRPSFVEAGASASLTLAATCSPSRRHPPVDSNSSRPLTATLQNSPPPPANQAARSIGECGSSRGATGGGFVAVPVAGATPMRGTVHSPYLAVAIKLASGSDACRRRPVIPPFRSWRYTCPASHWGESGAPGSGISRAAQPWWRSARLRRSQVGRSRSSRRVCCCRRNTATQ